MLGWYKLDNYLRQLPYFKHARETLVKLKVKQISCNTMDNLITQKLLRLILGYK